MTNNFDKFVEALEHVQRIMQELVCFMEMYKDEYRYEDIYGTSPYDILIQRLSITKDLDVDADMSAADAIDFLICNYKAQAQSQPKFTLIGEFREKGE